MDNFGEEKVTQELIAYAEAGDLETLRTTMSNQDQLALLDATARVLSSVSAEVMGIVKDMYIETIKGQIQADLNEMKSKEPVISKYNDMIQKELDKLDTKDSEQTKNVVIIIRELRGVLNDELSSLTKEKSLFKRLFKK